MVERSHTAGWLPEAYAQAYGPQAYPQQAYGYAPQAYAQQGYAPASRPSQKTGDWFAPKADAGMAEDAYEIALELPGVDPEAIQLTVQDGAVTVQGEKHVGREDGGWTYFFSEREFGAFQRSFRLPPDSAADRIDAAFKNGILVIRIPRLQAGGDSHRVAIRTE
jgi:HSP20 family protein